MCFCPPQGMTRKKKKKNTRTNFCHPPRLGTIPEICLCLCVFSFPEYCYRKFPLKFTERRGQNFPIFISCRYFDGLGSQQLGLPVPNNWVYRFPTECTLDTRIATFRCDKNRSVRLLSFSIYALSKPMLCFARFWFFDVTEAVRIARFELQPHRVINGH